jgi:hypothetical protein
MEYVVVVLAAGTCPSDPEADGDDTQTSFPTFFYNFHSSIKD